MACSFTRSSPRSLAAPRRALPSVNLRWLACSGAALAIGCSNGGQTGDEHGGSIEELRGTAQRLSPSGSLPSSASADGWEFGWRFYAEEAKPEENTFFSPYSISVASSMLIAGAAGETKAEIADALSFSTDGEGFHQARNTVAQALASRNRDATPDVNAQTLRVTNDFWMDPQFRPESSFLNTLSAYYGASAFLAPFATDPETARVAINDKVATDTEQLILDLLPPGSITPDVVFVLTNALYFKARWQTEFSKSATADEPFQAQSGASVNVPMMRGQLNASHFSGDTYEAVALPYQQNELELVAIMPTEGTFDAFVEGLTAADVARIQGELERSYLDLRFPKLEIKAKVPLKERLQALGMRGAFEPGADFSALAPRIYIGDAFHDATINIDEEGTVAAAATAFVGVATSAPPTPVPVVFDQPFVFFVRDIETNTLLFVGHYANP